MSIEYIVIQSNNIPRRMLQRTYNECWYLNVEDPTVPVGYKILVTECNIGNIKQRDITVHNGNNSWTRICYLYTDQDPIPEFHRNGRQWMDQRGAAAMGLSMMSDAKESYEQKKFYDTSSSQLLFDCREEYEVPGKVEWIYPPVEVKNEEQKAPSLNSFVLCEDVLDEMPTITVQHRFRTVTYREDEPIAFTPSVNSEANREYFEKK